MAGCENSPPNYVFWTELSHVIKVPGRSIFNSQNHGKAGLSGMLPWGPVLLGASILFFILEQGDADPLPVNHCLGIRHCPCAALTQKVWRKSLTFMSVQLPYSSDCFCQISKLFRKANRSSLPKESRCHAHFLWSVLSFRECQLNPLNERHMQQLFLIQIMGKSGARRQGRKELVVCTGFREEQTILPFSA